jgi:hypothetical protein
MKKLLLLILLLLIATPPITVYGSSLSFEKGEVNKSGVLLKGVNYESFSATTHTDSGTIGSQNVSYVKAKANSDAFIVTWGKTTKDQMTGANLLLLAKDFEYNNPEYIVLAGINGDYYNMSTFQPVNAHVQRGITIKDQNFSLDRYFSVGFTNDDRLFIANKNNQVETYYSLTVLDEGRVIKEVELQGFNQIPAENKSAIYFNLINIPTIQDADIFSVGIRKAINYGNYFLDGRIIESVESIVSNDQYFSIVTKDQELLPYLKSGFDVIVQKHMDGVYQGVDWIIGVGSQPLEDGVIKDFEDINDQNVSFAQARHPRSSFGFTEDGDFILMTIDGRQTDMDGVNLREMALAMQSLGAIQAFNLDGGGSTQLLIREDDDFVYLNQPSEMRRVPNGIFIVAPKIKVQGETFNLSYDGFDFSYNISDSIGSVLDYRVYLNDEQLDNNLNQFQFSGLDHDKIYYVSIEVDYDIDGVTYTNTFLNERVNLKPYAGDYVKKPPSNFIMDISNNDDIAGFDIFITYDDPDKTLTKMYLIYDEERVIISKSVGGYRVSVYNAVVDKNYMLKIEYFYRIDTITPVSEITEETYYYRYKPIVDEEITSTTTITTEVTIHTTTDDLPINSDDDFDFWPIIYTASTILILSIFIIIKRKK